MVSKRIEKFDFLLISFFRKYGDEFARIAFFLIFFWFGILKVLMVSPAMPLVVELLNNSFLSIIGDKTFLILFGLLEMAIGILALVPRLERLTFAVMGLHLVTTVLPLFVLPDITWHQIFVPTLVGQYIMKNAALLALGVLLASRLRPMKDTHTFIDRGRPLH